MSRLTILLLACLYLASVGSPAQTTSAEFTERTSIDFDTALQLLDPYGTWSKIDGAWAFTPTNRRAPYTEGRWLYSEYGWYWQGTEPHSWATEHYGFWKRGTDDHVWSWFPAATWLPQIVELRTTTTHVGWRCAEVDSDGNFVEEAPDRMAKVDEWVWVTRAQFTRPITPAVATSPEIADGLLGDSKAAMHTYVTYRAITRPGPHPADFLTLAGPGVTAADPRRASSMFPPQLASLSNRNKPAVGGATNNAAAAVTDENGAPADARQVPYWVTMNLPTYWTSAPETAQPNEVYFFQPNIYQDEDGIARRITLWFNPKTHATPEDLRTALSHGSRPTHSSGASAGNGRAAFQSPFEESFPNGSNKNAATPTTAPVTNTAPSGRAAP